MAVVLCDLQVKHHRLLQFDEIDEIVHQTQLKLVAKVTQLKLLVHPVMVVHQCPLILSGHQSLLKGLSTALFVTKSIKQQVMYFFSPGESGYFDPKPHFILLG